ncbi:uncharacterized protein LOC102807788 [Saccoglossus kowalevskii]
MRQSQKEKTDSVPSLSYAPSTTCHLQRPGDQPSDAKSDVIKLIRETDSRPPHPPPRSSSPDNKRGHSSVFIPRQQQKVKTTLTIRPRSNSLDASTSRSWQPINFKPVSKDDNDRTITSPPPAVPPPPQEYQYPPPPSPSSKVVKTTIMLQPEVNKPKVRGN